MYHNDWLESKPKNGTNQRHRGALLICTQVQARNLSAYAESKKNWSSRASQWMDFPDSKEIPHHFTKRTRFMQQKCFALFTVVPIQLMYFWIHFSRIKAKNIQLFHFVEHNWLSVVEVARRTRFSLVAGPEWLRLNLDRLTPPCWWSPDLYNIYTKLQIFFW